MNFTQQYYNDLEKAILGAPSGTTDPDRVDPMPVKSATSGMSTPAAATAPTKTATVNTGSKAKTSGGNDYSTTYELSLNLPSPVSQASASDPLTEDEKRKRSLWIMGGFLAAIIILIIALSRSKK